MKLGDLMLGMSSAASLLHVARSLGGALSYQTPGKTILVGKWVRDEDFAIHPKGSQPKNTLICPDNLDEPYLIPGHSYIFKTAKKVWQSQQAWSEVIAYRLGELVGLNVPPCFMAMDEGSGTAGVLMEFFFHYPDELVTPRLIHGADIMSRVIADRKRGRPHGVRHNITVCRRYGVANVLDWWGQVLAFDALIANVDRHPDNWGLMIKQSPEGRSEVAFSPIFDNGTSLGYGITDDQLKRIDDSRMDRFLAKGTHHCGWDVGEDGPTSHIELCRRYVTNYPQAAAAMKTVIHFDSRELRSILDECTTFDTPIRFTRRRSEFVYSLVEARKAQLKEILK